MELLQALPLASGYAVSIPFYDAFLDLVPPQRIPVNVVNVHHRIFDAPAARVAALLDTLASDTDHIWPREAWPAMVFDRPLGVGAEGGHGPVRYAVCKYVPGNSVVFAFHAPAGFHGTHRFDVLRLPHGCELRHTLSMRAGWPAVVTWPLLFRPMHDALIEDALAKAQAGLGERPSVVPWSLYVRALRRLFSVGRAPRPQTSYDSASLACPPLRGKR
ncbi:MULTISPECIES: hypothetical protein [Lysobacteraceae]|nr:MULTISPECIES: hypothetical protein [Lysobacter]